MDVIQELEEKIKDFIECKYKCKFTGKVRVVYHQDEYCLWLTLNNWLVPLNICYQTNDPDIFLTYIQKELTKRHIDRVGFYKLVMEHGHEQKG